MQNCKAILQSLEKSMEGFFQGNSTKPTPDWRGGAAVATAMEGVGPPGTPESGWRKEMSARIKPKNKMVEQSDYRPRNYRPKKHASTPY